MTAWDEEAVDLEHVLENLEALWQDVSGWHVCGATQNVADRILADLRVLISCFIKCESDTFMCIHGFRVYMVFT